MVWSPVLPGIFTVSGLQVCGGVIASIRSYLKVLMKTRAVFVVAFVIASIKGEADAWAFGWSFRNVYTDYHLEYRIGRPVLSGFTIGYDKGSMGCTGINYLGYGLSYASNHELTQWSAFASCYRFGFANVQFS